MKSIYKDISIASNEFVSKFAINRNIEKLLNNDQYIYLLYNKYMMSGPGVFIKGLKYPIGYKVWHRDDNNRLCVYMNTKENNVLVPSDVDSGWINTAFHGEIDLVSEYLNIIKSHIEKHIEEFHLDKELVKTDLSNTDFDLYPYLTKCVRSIDQSVTGYARKWKNGILEYFINYRFNENTINMLDKDVLKYFGGMLNSFGRDLKTFSNPTVPNDINEYFETDTIKTILINLHNQYTFRDSEYCVFTSNALDAAKLFNSDLNTANANNYSPIDTVLVFNKKPSSLSLMRRFAGGSYVGNVLDNDDNPLLTKNVLQRLTPANKSYTLYLIGNW